ncbi:MAG: MerR family DNA-binding transcriptional regulator [Hydrogenophilaceae bacterium]|jgi:DNA-binding transcriptional MerR regulator|nr:MerR family DNA-binding transcriptional regulator [Hydrogenophilaceae bacterium]
MEKARSELGKSERTYSISELAREFKVTPRALRFYEDKGLLSPRRDGLNRVYLGRDRARLMLILQGKRIGLSLIEIKEILDLYNADEQHRLQNQVALKKFKQRLVALEQQRRDIEGAIEALTNGIIRLERLLSEPAPAESLKAARAYEQEARRRLQDA